MFSFYTSLYYVYCFFFLKNAAGRDMVFNNNNNHKQRNIARRVRVYKMIFKLETINI